MPYFPRNDGFLLLGEVLLHRPQEDEDSALSVSDGFAPDVTHDDGGLHCQRFDMAVRFQQKFCKSRLLTLHNLPPFISFVKHF